MEIIRGHNQLHTPRTPYLGAMRAQPLSLIACYRRLPSAGARSAPARSTRSRNGLFAQPKPPITPVDSKIQRSKDPKIQSRKRGGG